jgi:hypothetical protein
MSPSGEVYWEAMQPHISLSASGHVLVPRARTTPPPVAGLTGISERDRQILALALHLLGGTPPDFSEALCAVRAAVEELIPAGRVYHLGTAERGRIVGSLVSGVGIMEGAGEVVVVRVDRRGRWTALGSLWP